MSIGKYILIDPSECPARVDLGDSIERLYKCARLLEGMPSRKDADPDSLRRVASFLEQIFKDNRLKQSAMDDELESDYAEAFNTVRDKI